MRLLTFLSFSLSCMIAQLQLHAEANYNQIISNQEAVLEASLEIIPANPIKDNPKIILPGTPLLLSAKIKNNGSKPNAEGYLFVRFVYPEPLQDQANSQLYLSEQVALPAVDPGKEALVTFSAKHQTPSLFDFIRQDWGMRQYQTVAVIGGKEYILGSTALTFSAYYYGAEADEEPKAVPAATK